MLATIDSEHDDTRKGGPLGISQAAALAFRKMLVGDNEQKTAVEISRSHGHVVDEPVDPMEGWSDGVSPKKSHFCLLLKPQVILRCDSEHDSVCVLAASQAHFQTFSIMDDSNADDPVSGKVMTRSVYT